MAARKKRRYIPRHNPIEVAEKRREKIAIPHSKKLRKITHKKIPCQGTSHLIQVQHTFPQRFSSLFSVFRNEIIPRLKKQKKELITIGVIGAGAQHIVDKKGYHPALQKTEKKGRIITHQPEEIENELLHSGLNYKITATDFHKEVTEHMRKQDKVRWLSPRIERKTIDITISGASKKFGKKLINVMTTVSPHYISSKKAADFLDKTTKTGGFVITQDEKVLKLLKEQGYQKISFSARFELLKKPKKS